MQQNSHRVISNGVKAAIFDLSGVCFSDEESPFLVAFAQKHRLPLEAFTRDYMELLVQSENGEITGSEVWKRLLSKYAVEGDAEALIREMMAGKESYQDKLDFVSTIRKEVKTAYFTNYNEDYWKLIVARFDLSKYFDIGLVSYEIGARKPSAKGFIYLLEKLGARPEEAVFIDDRSGNLEEPKKLGINTIQFKSVTDLGQEIERLGIKMNE